MYSFLLDVQYDFFSDCISFPFVYIFMNVVLLKLFSNMYRSEYEILGQNMGFRKAFLEGLKAFHLDQWIYLKILQPIIISLFS